MKIAIIFLVASTVCSGLFLETSSATIGESAGSLVTAIIDSVLNLLQNGLNLTSGQIKKDLQALADLFKLLRDVITQLLDKIFKGGLDGLKNLCDTLSKLIADLKALLAKIAENAGIFLKNLLQTISAELDKLVAKLKELLKPILDKLLEVVKGLVANSVQIVKDLLTKIEQDLTEQNKALLTQLKDLLNQLLVKLDDLVKKLVDVLANGSADALSSLKALVDEILNIVSQIKTLGDQGGSVLGTGINSILANLIKILETALKTVADILAVLGIGLGGATTTPVVSA